MSKFRRLMTVGGLAATMALVAVMGTVASSDASSHREALQISQDPVADNVDTYVFRSPDKPDTVTLVGNWIPLEEPAGGPNFHQFGDDVLYTLNVDNDGDAVDDIVWEFRFSTRVLNRNTFLYNTGPISSLNDPDFNIRQSYSVAKVQNGRRQVIGSGLRVPPANIGLRSTPNYAQLASAAIANLSDGSKVFAGPRDDPFFVDLGSAFDLLGLRPFNGAHAIPLPQDKGHDGVSGYNTHSVVLQVPIKNLTKDKKALTGADDPDATIGVYAASWRRQVRVLSKDGGDQLHTGRWVQVSRLGMPLVNEVVIPVGLKDYFNGSKPTADGAALPLVQDPELPHLLNAVYGLAIPDSDPDTAGIQRDDLIQVFLTGVPKLNMPDGGTPSEMIRLNMSIPPCSMTCSSLGVLDGDLAGFPNGRRLGDDIIDASLRVVLGVLLPNHEPIAETIGDGVDANDVPFNSSFPYVAYPHSGSDADPH